jgi:multiple sugar transport system permease protein
MSSSSNLLEIPTEANKTRRSRLKVPSIAKAFSWLLIIILTLWLTFPFLWAITTSVKRPDDVYKSKFIPFLQYQPTLENWKAEFSARGREIRDGLTNSVIVGTGSAFLSTLLGALGGYALARGSFKRSTKENLFSMILSQRMLLPAVTVIPYFMMMKTVGWIDRPAALIVAHTTFNLAFALLLMRDFFQSVPVELDEAALVDGATDLQSFLLISLPLAAPGLVTTFILGFAFSWNEFMYALALTYRQASTIPIVIAGAEDTRGIQFWYISTRTLIAILPPLVVVSFIQKYLVRGLTLGAVKG